LKKVEEIVENAVLLTTVALVVGLLIVVFNPRTGDSSRSPVPAGTMLEP